jgi:hypothetical protein
MEPHAVLKVFLADDSAAIRQRVAGLLGPTLIVGEAETPRHCIDGILQTRPDSTCSSKAAPGWRS